MKIEKKKLKNLWMPLDLRRKLIKNLMSGWIKTNKEKFIAFPYFITYGL